MRGGKKQKTALIRKSVFPESRELLTCFERDTDTLFTCRSFFTAETDRNITAANKILKIEKKKKKALYRVQMLGAESGEKTALQRQSDSTNVWI